MEKKKVLILSSAGGGGHIIAASTLHSLVGDTYDLKVVQPIDQLRIWGVPSGEQFYNAVLRNGWIRSMNFIVRHLVPPLFRSRLKKIEKIIASYMDTYKPDLVISLIPFVNYPASEAARKKEIPYLLITTDNDLRHWSLEMEKIKHPHFKVTIGADLPLSRNVLLKKKIPSEAIETIGLPLRPQFIEEKNVAQIREEFQFPAGKEIVLIMTGGVGANIAYDYAQKIGGMDLGVHLIVIAGRNTALKKDLERLRLHPSNSLTAFGFTDRISDLMAISDLVITKPGPGTINEAIAMKLPILIDNTNISLFWERGNVDMILNYGVGDRIRKFKDVKKMLKKYVHNPRNKEKCADSYALVPPNQFHLKIQGIIEEMLSWREEIVEKRSESIATLQVADASAPL